MKAVKHWATIKEVMDIYGVADKRLIARAIDRSLDVTAGLLSYYRRTKKLRRLRKATLGCKAKPSVWALRT
jgi:hypothetical protein